MSSDSVFVDFLQKVKLIYAVKCLSQTNRGRGLALSRGGGGQGSHKNQAPFSCGGTVQNLPGDLGQLAAIEDQVIRARPRCAAIGAREWLIGSS